MRPLALVAVLMLCLAPLAFAEFVSEGVPYYIPGPMQVSLADFNGALGVAYKTLALLTVFSVLWMTLNPKDMARTLINPDCPPKLWDHRLKEFGAPLSTLFCALTCFYIMAWDVGPSVVLGLIVLVPLATLCVLWFQTGTIFPELPHSHTP